MNSPKQKLTKNQLLQRSKVPVTNEHRAKIIEMFTCEKENQLVKIAAATGISYHNVFKIIDQHSKAIVRYRSSHPNDEFLTLESSINK